MTSNMHKSEYVPALDGLRGLAIILVIGCHFFFDFGIFRLGWIGVDLFFVLSGYLIASRFIRQPVSFKLVKIFYRNRILRILPLYFAFLLFFLVVWYLLPVGRKVLLYIPSVPHFWLQHFFLVQNWMYVSSTSDAQLYNPLMHLWSIAIEEQFYLFFPFLIWMITKIKHKLFFITSVIILVAVLRSFDFYQLPVLENKLRYYCNSFYRLDTFLAGVLLAYLLRNCKDHKYLQRIFQCLLLATLGSYIFMVSYKNNLLSDNPLMITAGYTVLALLFMSLTCLVVIQKKGIINRVFSNRFLVFSGKISYGLYIFHFPLDFFKNTLLHSWFKIVLQCGNEKTVSFIFTFFLLGILYGLSYTSYIYFERYFLKRKKAYPAAMN